MMAKDLPLISIITPVYNGEKFLDDCIRSVISQTYPNWEYIIANNCSTDRTLQIAKKYASKDERIKIYTNRELVNALRNHNTAIKKIAIESKYIKFVHSDDRLYPECVEKMVLVAEANPSVGIVGSYLLYDKEIRCVGIPFPTNIVKGKEICRSTFRGEFTVFGPPSATLLRSEYVKKYSYFYREDILFADADVCFRLLKNYDFGFVHQVLSCIRVHKDSRTSRLVEPFAKEKPEMLEMLVNYGVDLFDENEYQELLSKRMSKYYRFLAKRMFFKNKKGFWTYHKKYMEKLGFRFSYIKISVGLAKDIIIRLLNLQDSFEKIIVRKVISRKG